MPRRASLVAVIVALTASVFAFSVAAKDAQLVISGARIYPSPTATPIDKGTVIIRNGRIAEVTGEQSTALPSAERIIETEGLVVTAGFWNCHVHFTEPKWTNASALTEGELSEHLRAMLTRYGFTSVVDTGSYLANTQALRKRIALGVQGPQILTASGSFVPEDGSPAYLEVKLPELKTPGQAEQLTKEVLAQGADAIKIFTGSYLGQDRVALMPLPVIKAVTIEVHRHQKLVLAHPQSLRGVELALDGGVDILVHTAPQGGAWPEAMVEGLVQNGVGLIPTLKLWRFELTRAGVPSEATDRFQAMGVEQLRTFAAAGGDVLFGTDVGYMTDYDPTEEYQHMGEAGLSFEQILASLTINPIRRFDSAALKGEVEPGRSADLVILAADPRSDVGNFARVRYTIRAGEVIYESP